MGLFKTAPTDTSEKPFMLGVEMNSTIKCKTLTDLAKHLLWVEDNIPNTKRNVEIETIDDYWVRDGAKYKIKVRWTEQRGGNEIDDALDL